MLDEPRIDRGKRENDLEPAVRAVLERRLADDDHRELIDGVRGLFGRPDDGVPANEGAPLIAITVDQAPDLVSLVDRGLDEPLEALELIARYVALLAGLEIEPLEGAELLVRQLARLAPRRLVAILLVF